MPLTQFSFTTQFEKDRTTVVRLPSLSSMVNTGSVVPIVTPQFIPDRRESANVLMGPPPIPTPMPQTFRTSALDVGMNSGSVSISGPVRYFVTDVPDTMPPDALVLILPAPKILRLSVVPEVSLPQALPLPPFPPTLRLSIRASVTLRKTITIESSKEEPRDITVHVDESSRAELRGRPVVVDGAFAILDSLQMWIWDGPAGKWNGINFGDDHILAGKTYHLSLYRGLSGGMEPEWVTERGFHNLLREIRSRNEIQTEIEHLYATLEEMQSSSEAFNTNTIALVKATHQSLSQMVVHTHNLVAYVNGFKMDFSLKLESNLRQTQLHSSNPRKDISQNRDRIHLILTHLRARLDQTTSAPNSVTQAIGEGCKTVQFHSVWMPSTPRSTPLPLSQSHSSYLFPPTQEFQIPGSLDEFTEAQLMTLFRKFKNQRVAEVSDTIIECQQQRRKIAEDTRERFSLLQRREVHHKNAYSQIDAQAVTMIESLNRKLGEVEERVRQNAESTASLAVKQLWSQSQNFSDLWSILLRHLLANSDHMQDASTRIQLAKETLEALRPQLELPDQLRTHVFKARGVFENHEPCMEDGANTGTSGCTKERDIDSTSVIFSEEVGQQLADNGNTKSHHELNSGYPDELDVTASNDISNRELISRESPNVPCLMEDLRMQDWRNVVQCGETPFNTLLLEHLGESLAVSSGLFQISEISGTSEENRTAPLVIREIIQVNGNSTTSVSKGALQDIGIELNEASEVGVSQSALVFENSGPQINQEVSSCEPEHSTKEIEDENLDQKLPDVSCGLDAAVKPIYDMDSGQTPLSEKKLSAYRMNIDINCTIS
ncbi:hypothetical protein C8J55DRAFT_489696 [Lentinula edodes]|uniref:Uncharacterized protein n=1 Tax=Lentinula lateritia TaxID=40482 RepID=A0A9W9DN71_9AGAR|nr:hypothetical protein C8J55DRAFT_489696 [Lentinula edodes]